MSRIEKTFKSLKRPALITFVMGGDPGFDASLEILKRLPDAGADIIEIGMPFTDPVADGPVIQAAGLRALGAGMTTAKIFALVKAFRENNTTTPIVLMGYANTVYARGFEKFTAEAAAAGADGLIIVDLPPEEDSDLRAACRKNALELIRLIAPTSDAKRLPMLLKDTGGFVYYVSIAGITGAAKAKPDELKSAVVTLRAHTDLPLAIGFGVKTADDVRSFAGLADAVVVGSSIVQNIADHKDAPDLPDRIAVQIKMLAAGLR